jgi:hypothetical protein
MFTEELLKVTFLNNPPIAPAIHPDPLLASWSLLLAVVLTVFMVECGGTATVLIFTFSLEELVLVAVLVEKPASLFDIRRCLSKGL